MRGVMSIVGQLVSILCPQKHAFRPGETYELGGKVVTIQEIEDDYGAIALQRVVHFTNGEAVAWGDLQRDYSKGVCRQIGDGERMMAGEVK